MYKYYGPVPQLHGLLDASHFSQALAGTIHIEFEDGSYASFNDAFWQYEKDKQTNEMWIAVYTEHCGYHMFLCRSVVRINKYKLEHVMYNPNDDE